MAESKLSKSNTVDNQRSLKSLARAIGLGQGQFSLIFARCNYAQLRKRMVANLGEEVEDVNSLGELKTIELLPETTSLYNRIRATMGEITGQPSALMVLGLESVTAIDELLFATNFVRDELRKQLTFPLVLWVNDQVLQKLRRFAPDFASFAANPIKFDLTTEELQDLIVQKANFLFASVLAPNPREKRSQKTGEKRCGLVQGKQRLELDAAHQELLRRSVNLSPELQASLEFVFGQDDLANDRIDAAIERYSQSLRLWRKLNNREQTEPFGKNREKSGVLLYYLGRCHVRKAQRYPTEAVRQGEEAWIYFNQAVKVFEEVGRHDLVAQFIDRLMEVLQSLEKWEALSAWTYKSLSLHQTYGCQLQLALDYGYLAKIAAREFRWAWASQLAQKALDLLAEAPLFEQTSLLAQPHQLYRLLWEQIWRLVLVQALKRIFEFQAADENLDLACQKLKNAIAGTEHRYGPDRYLRLLKELRRLYFELGRYREAFEIKQKERSIEQQYGFRAFIGAGQLLPARHAINPVLAPGTKPRGTVAEAIAASRRQQDINGLLERIGRSDYKLTVIHGQSGVGKSSIVTAGLVPTLKYHTVGDRVVLPVVLRVYRDWVGVLGRTAIAALSQIPDFPLPDKLYSTAAILELLREAEERNRLTVLIFDQFEEFFVVCSDPEARKYFADFLQACLNITSLKVIVSIREDYLHNLLEFERQMELEEINGNLLDKSNRYPLGNLSPQDAYEVIESLTQKANFELEDSLIEELVDDLAGERGEVRPIELQVVGYQLQAEDITTLAKYQRWGPKQRLVERFLEEVVKDCGTENQPLARRVLYLLTDENGNRPLKSRAELAAELANPEQLNLILDILVGSGLVSLIPELPAPRYQLVHDYLGEFIQQQEEVVVKKERDELRLKEEENNQYIKKMRQEIAVLAELADERYKIVQQDLETYIPQSKGNDKNGSLSELSAARKREELSYVWLEQLRQEKDLLAALADAKQKHRQSDKQFKGSLYLALAVLVLGILALGGSTFQAISQFRQAVINEVKAVSASSEALFASHKELDALLEGIRAAKKLEASNWADARTKDRVRTALQEVVYKVKERNRLQGHTHGVYSVSWSADDRLIASAGADNTIKLWGTDGALIKTLPAHGDRVTSVSFSPDGRLIASASWDGTVKIWRRSSLLQERRKLQPFTMLEGHKEEVLSVSFSPNGRLIATASRDGTVKIWRRDGRLLTTLEGHTGPVTSISWSPDGQYLVSGSADKTIHVWGRNGELLKTLEDHGGQVTSVKWSPRGDRIASASLDKTVKLWSPEGELIDTFRGHDDSVFSVAFSPNGKTIASGSGDNTVKLWSLQGRLLNTLMGHSDWVSSVTFSPDGKTLVSASRDKIIKLWTIDKSWLTTLKGKAGAVNGVSWSPDGQMIATAHTNNTLKLWQPDGTFIETLQGHGERVNAVAWHPQSQAIASASQDKTVKLWQEDGQLLQTLGGHEDSVLGVSFSPDGEYIASGSRDKTVKLWLADGTLLSTLEGHTGPVNWVSFSPDGQTIASGSEDNTVKLWTIDGELLDTLQGHTDGVWEVTFSPDGKLMATASADKTIIIWSRDGTRLSTLRGHTDLVSGVSFSPDSQAIATSSNDNTVRIWTIDGKLLHTLKGHNKGVTSVSFGPKGRVASASADGTVILWDLADVTLENMLMHGCDWLSDYLQHNPDVETGDRTLCEGIE